MPSSAKKLDRAISKLPSIPKERVAQLINWLGFGLQPTLPIRAGGSSIVAGGLMIAFWSA
jgi:hypothetical protein